MPADYYSEKLDTTRHDRRGFSCGTPELDRYFREQAAQDQRRRLAVPYVLIEAATGNVVGYYTLSMRSIDRDGLPLDIAVRLRYRHIPVVLIGRLALHKDYQGKGLGRHLLSDALLRTIAVSDEVGAFAVMVEAKNEAAIAFYKHAGFTLMLDRPDTLFIPIDSIKNALGK